MTTLFEYLNENKNDLTNHDLSVLADWANEWKGMTPNQDWKKAYSLIREGADLLLRRRARSTVVMSGPLVNDPKATSMPYNVSNEPKSPQVGTYVDYLELRKQIGDWTSIFYGPHSCSRCGEMIIKKAVEQGGTEFSMPEVGRNYYVTHVCTLPMKS